MAESNRSTRNHLLALAVMTTGLGTGSAWSQTLLLDFGNDNSFRGVSVTSPDANGNTWNSLQTGLFYTDLLDTAGNATTIDFGFSTGVGTDSFNGPAGITSNPPTAGEIATADAALDKPALGDFGVVEAAMDFVAGNVRFEIQQLDPAKTYDLTFFGSHKFNIDDVTVYRVYTDNTYSTLVDSTQLTVGVGPDHNSDTLATITGLAPQVDDILYVEFEAPSGNTGYLNALRIAETTTALVPGDADGDGDVDDTDLGIAISNFTGPGGSGKTVADGDTDGDGDVDDTDLGVAISGFTGPLSPAAVPEPASLALLGLGGLLITRRRRG